MRITTRHLGWIFLVFIGAMFLISCKKDADELTTFQSLKQKAIQLDIKGEVQESDMNLYIYPPVIDIDRAITCPTCPLSKKAG